MLPQSLEEWRQLVSIAASVGLILTFLFLRVWPKLERRAEVAQASPFDRPASLNTRLIYLVGWALLAVLAGGTFIGGLFMLFIK